MNHLRWLLAVIMWRFQCWGFLRWFLPYAGGRHIDWAPCRCEECGWRGPVRWAFHTYHGCGEDDVEPVDECPRCYSADLNEQYS